MYWSLQELHLGSSQSKTCACLRDRHAKLVMHSFAASRATLAVNCSCHKLSTRARNCALCSPTMLKREVCAWLSSAGTGLIPALQAANPVKLVLVVEAEDWCTLPKYPRGDYVPRADLTWPGAQITSSFALAGFMCTVRRGAVQCAHCWLLGLETRKKKTGKDDIGMNVCSYTSTYYYVMCCYVKIYDKQILR